MKFTVTLVDPEVIHTVIVDARDRRAFELSARKVFGTPADGNLRSVANSMPENYSYWLAWHALVRDGINISWPDFDSRAVAIESEGDDAPDPTKPGRIPG